MKNEDFKGLEERLDKLDWPSVYMFKFIVPIEKEEELLLLFNSNHVERKISKTGKYVGITSSYWIGSGSEVIAVYKKAATIEGIVSL
jgi:uncharacterized protein